MPSTTASPGVPSLQEQLVHEACSMVRHLVTNGTRVPAQLVQSADRFETAAARGRQVDVAALASVHERLSRLVAPAKPGTLYLLDDSYHQAGQSSLGPVRLVRDLVRVAMACVAVFIVLSVMSIADAHPSVSLFGSDLPVVEIILERVFWLAAAGIGASFAMLFQLNDQIVNRTFDPDENASYWVKFFLGLVAGFILVALVPIEGTATAPGETETSAQVLGPPTIALLGGFSASAVYRILTRMVEALESIFSGGAREQTLAAEKAAVTRAAEETSQARMAVAGQLVDIQQRLAAGITSDEAAARLRQVVSGLMPGGTEAMDTAAAPADKVPALAVVAAPEDVAAQPDASAPADAPAAEEEQPRETAAAAG
jgi:hypothetical protein